MYNNKFKLALVASAVSFAISAPQALAQDATNQKSIEKIEVTGSHIRRTDMEGPSPVATLTAEDIEKTGVTDLIGLFTKLPISGQGTFSTQGNSSDGTANGGSSISLRGLGADSTLILINGRRVAVSPFARQIDTAFVDINNIPIAAIKRIDILKDGASATYGADAIAGVINVILKDDYEGFEISAKTSDTSEGGGAEQNLSILWGSKSNNSSHTFIVDYFDREETLYGDRHYAATANQAARTGLPDANDFRSSSGIPGTIALASNPGNRLIDTFGNDVCAPEDTDLANNLCRYDYAPHMTLVPATERVSFNYMGNYEISDTTRVFTEFSAQNSKTVIKGAASPSFNELFMSGDNPNHPFADDADHEFHGQDLTMRRRTVDIGNRKKLVNSDYYRAIIGAEGEIGEWEWEAAYSYIKSESVERGVDGFPNIVRMQEAIDSGLYNPFEPSSNTQEALDYFETTTTRTGKSSNKSVDVTVSGPIADLPAGELMLAVGAEHRKESIADNPDAQYINGEIFGTEATAAAGGRDNTAVYAELAIPALDTLELQVAVRHEDYSDFGKTTDPKLAFIWNPSEDLSIRGSYGTAFRAPSLHQIGLGDTQESPNLIDKARCDAVGNINKACELQEYTAIITGNRDLNAETSTSYNIGLIYQFTDNFDFSLDYYDYDIEDVILKDTQDKFDKEGLNPDVVVRLPSDDPNDPGEVVLIRDRYENLGNVSTTGLDLDLSYRMENDMGTFDFSYVLNYVLDYEDFRPTVGVFAQEGDFTQPEYRWTIAGTWSKDDWAANFAVNYIAEFKQDQAIRTRADGTFLPDVDAMTTVDASVSYLGFDNISLTLGATNLFDEEPPFSYHDFMGYVNDVHSAQGRFVYLKATYSF